MKNYNIIIVILLLVMAGLGGYIIVKKPLSSSLPKETLPSWSGSISQTSTSTPQTPTFVPGFDEFVLLIGENTKIFGIDEDNPYIGEPPAPANIGSENAVPQTFVASFEIWGDVVRVDYEEHILHLAADYPRPIDKEFTPRGPLLSLEDMKEGVRIVVSGDYDEKGEVDLKDIDFIQVIHDDIHRF